MPYTYPLPIEHPAEPAQLLTKLRNEEPVAPVLMATGESAWLVTRYDDARAVFSDRRLRARFPGVQVSGLDVDGLAESTDLMLLKDGAEHARLRNLVSKAFSARYVDSLRPQIEGRAESLLDTMIEHGSPDDLVGAFAVPYASHVMTDLLDVDLADREEFHRLAQTSLASSALTEYSEEDVSAAVLGLLVQVSNLVAVKRAAPGADLFSHLISINDADGGQLTDGELLGLGVTLMTAGYIPTVAAIVRGVLVLLHDESRYAVIRDHPDRIPTVVEEILRLEAADGDPMRVAKEDVVIAGTPVRAGEVVILSRAAANRDPHAFDDPESFRPDRQDNPHLVFGHGIHHCVGAALARLEMHVALGSLARRLPTLTLAGPAGELEWPTGMLLPLPRVLPVAW